MSEPFPIKVGDRVRVTFCGRTIEAVIVLASENGASLWIEFDGMLGGADGYYCGGMPLLWAGDCYRDLGNQGIAVLERLVE